MEVPILENRERLRTQVTQVAPSQVGPRRTGGGASGASMGSPSLKDQTKELGVRGKVSDRSISQSQQLGASLSCPSRGGLSKWMGVGG